MMVKRTYEKLRLHSSLSKTVQMPLVEWERSRMRYEYNDYFCRPSGKVEAVKCYHGVKSGVRTLFNCHRCSAKVAASDCCG